MKLNFR